MRLEIELDLDEQAGTLHGRRHHQSVNVCVNGVIDYISASALLYWSVESFEAKCPVRR